MSGLTLEILAPARAERARQLLPSDVPGARRIGTAFTRKASSVLFDDNEVATDPDVPPTIGTETDAQLRTYLRTRDCVFDLRRPNGTLAPMPMFLDLLVQRAPSPLPFVAAPPTEEVGLLIVTIWNFYEAVAPVAPAVIGTPATFSQADVVPIGPFGRVTRVDFRNGMIRRATPTAMCFSLLQVRNRPLPLGSSYEVVAACDVT